MSDNSGVGATGGSGWGQLGLLVAAGSVGALLLLTPLAGVVVPSLFLIVAIIKLRGSSAGKGVVDGVDDTDHDGVNDALPRSAPSSPPEFTRSFPRGDGQEALSVGNSTKPATPAEAVPPQPPTVPPARRSDLLSPTTVKAAPNMPSTQLQQQSPDAAPSAPVTAAPLAISAVPAPAAPPAQQTPTRGLVPDSAPAPPQPTKAADIPSDAAKPEPPTAPPPAPTASPTAAPAAVTGGAAILARFRKQRTDTAQSLATTTDLAAAAAAAAAARSPPATAPTPTPKAAVQVPVTILYGSQTGTCLEIARNLAAEAVSKGFNASCASLNEFGFAALSPARTPLLVIVSSSTGDGDPPDNASAFFAAMRRKPPTSAPPPPPAPLAGVRYTVLGLGDSNYTRFMYVPRALRGRLVELGAAEFYKCAEADEVEGVENVVDPWMEGLWVALKAAIDLAGGAYSAAAAAAGASAAAAEKQAAEAAAAKAAADAAEEAAVEAAAKAAAEATKVEATKVEAAKAEAEAKAVAMAAEAEAAKAAAQAAQAKAAAKAAAEAAEAEAARAAAEAEATLKAAAAAAAEAAKALAEPAQSAEQAATAAEAAPSLEPPQEPEAPAPAEAPAPGTPPPATDPPTRDAVPSATAAAAPPPADAFETAAAEAAVAAAAGAPSEAPDSLLPDSLLAVMEAGVAPTAASVGLPTIAESRVLEDVPEAASATDGEQQTPAAAAVAPLPITSSGAGDGRPGTSVSVTSSVARQNGALSGTYRRSMDMAASPGRQKPPSRLQAKPTSVNFPKREDTVVKRKDEKAYGMLMGLAPVGVDTKGAPALLPCRLKVVWEKDEGRARGVREQEAVRPTREERHRVDPAGNYTADRPFWAHISAARYETAFWSDRKVIHLELSIRGSNITYQPGDSIGVLPVNHPDLVANLCKRLHLNPDKVFSVQAATANGGEGGRVASHIPSPCSVAYALSHCVDLTSVTRKSVLRLLAEHATDAAERRTLMYLSSKSPGGKEAYGHEVGEHQPSLLDLLVRFRSVNPPFEPLLDALPPLMPRMYSVSSSQKDPSGGPMHLSVALSVVRFKTRYGTRLGVATTWLDRLAAPWTADGAALPEAPVYLPIFLRRAADFKPPPSLAVPLIMVGPGTGVAPFRGFLQERRADIAAQKPAPGSLGEAVLFFGCRREDEDYMYREELEAFKAEGTLTALHVAFSRAQADKVYVQDLLKQQGEQVWALIQAGAHVYVCGDGASMAKDVNAALAGIAQQHGGMSEADAAALLQNMAQERRYVRDVWS